MSSWKWLPNFIFLISLINLVAIVRSQFPTEIFIHYNCSDNGSRNPRNSMYERNLGTSLSSVLQNIDANGFYNTSTGENPDRVNVIALCRADLQPSQCRDYMKNATAEILKRCPNQKQAILWHEFCMVRFSDEAIFGTLANSPMNWGKGKNTSRTIIIVIVPIVACLILALCIGIYLKTKKMRTPRENVDLDGEISTVESLQYDFGTIRVATDNFSDANKLGQGGFGVVYKGRLPKGNEIAVKRLSHGSRQGDLEFKNEVLLVARLQHRNLVRLLGFSVEGNERLLIYELVQNGSLDRFIFDPNNPCMDWEKRYIIIGGVARGLLYLHEDSRLRIIHRDLKASNVLIDGEMNPKISDFGMARLFVPDETHHSTSRIVGTYGYMAPEYAIHGHFSIKSDVYSFGVLILEIVSGQKAYNFQDEESMDDLISFVWKNWHQGTVANIIDPALRTSSGSMRDITRCIHIGLLCVQENAADRPTMGSVVLMLSSFSLTLPVPSQPALFMSRSFRPEISFPYKTHSSKDQSNNSTHLSINEASMSELYPR